MTLSPFRLCFGRYRLVDSFSVVLKKDLMTLYAFIASFRCLFVWEFMMNSSHFSIHRNVHGIANPQCRLSFDSGDYR